MDPNRRQNIIEATLDVIAERGLNGLTHRLIARAAGVPLSATSYYFGSIDELVEAAIRQAIERDRVRFSERVAEVQLDRDPLAGMTLLTIEALRDSRATVLSLEVIVAALRNDRLVPLAQAWDDAWVDVLAPWLGSDKARFATSVLVATSLRGSMHVNEMTPSQLNDFVHENVASLLGPVFADNLPH